MLKQVMATGDVAPQKTLKRTREAVSRWLITNENGKFEKRSIILNYREHLRLRLNQNFSLF